MKSMKLAVALICALAMIFAMTGCNNDAAGNAEANAFEAEHAIITAGTGMWNPITEVGVDVGGEEPARVDGISNISDGSALTWKITSDKAGTATLTLRAASHLRDWGTEIGGSIGVDDVSKALALTVNGNAVAISGSLLGGAVLPENASGGTAYIVADITVTVELVEGENVIVFTSLGDSTQYNLFMDKLIVDTNANLTFTKTDNSGRVWGG